MAKIESINTKNTANIIGSYSQAVKAGEFVFVSGQIGIDPKTGVLKKNDVAEQTKQALLNSMAILKEACSSFDNIVKVTIFLRNMKDFDTVDKVYSGFFKGRYPARCCVEVSNLPGGAEVEIEVTSLCD